MNTEQMLKKENGLMDDCPFCGHKGVIQPFYGIFQGRCPNPKCQVEIIVSAIKPYWVRRKWNKRAP